MTRSVEAQVRYSSRSKIPIGQAWLCLLSVLVGLVAGCGAILFRGLIGLFHNILFFGQFSMAYDASVHTPASRWGAGVILAPVVGAVGVAFLVKNFALEAKGHGVPEVMEAIYYQKGVIRPIVALIKSLASALSIGSGGSVGREGPIVQIGAAFGSTVGQWLRLPAWQRITVIAAGAGGGIAATFNTPIGGVLFAAELLLHEVSVWTLVPVVISTATATYVGRLFLGANPAFIIPAFQMPYYHATRPAVLLAYVGLGLLLGLVSTLFIRAIYGGEDFFDRKVPGGYYARHLSGMLLVGLLIYALQARWGHYYVQGVGYSTVQDILSGALTSPPFLLLLFGLKMLATSLTIGSGGSGGIFSPSLFLGATFGGAYGLLLERVFPGLLLSPPAFAVVGMAGMVGGATGAAITSIVMIFEMTLDYNVVVPMTITVAISYGLRKYLCPESIYTLKLARRGHHMPEALQANFYLVKLARDLMEQGPPAVPAGASPEAAIKALSQAGRHTFCLVEDRGQVVGVLDQDAALAALLDRGKGASVGDIANRDFGLVAETTTLFELITRSKTIRVFLVASEHRPLSVHDIKGVVSKGRMIDAIADSMAQFAQ